MNNNIEDEKIIENYIPVYSDFCYKFSDSECYFKKYGTCPVEINRDKLLANVEYNTSCKCESLIQNIIVNGFYERTKACEILVMKSLPCGKYSFNNGRHRTCAASKLKVPIKIHISNDTCRCTCDRINEF